jgi:hypothetical protein
MLTGSLSSCSNNSNSKESVDLKNALNEYTVAHKSFAEHNNLSVTPVVIHEDAEKTVIMFTQGGFPRCSFNYK